MRLTSFLVLSASVASCFADATPLIDTINNKLSAQVDIFAKDVQAFPASGLVGAATIVYDSRNVSAVFVTATNDAKNAGPLSQTQGLTIISDLNLVLTPFVNALTDLDSKKADFDNLVFTASPTIYSELSNLDRTSIGFFDVIIANAPITQVPASIAAKNEIGSALAAALGIYQD